ncbi:hypothetical protein HNP12_003771 [Aeromonas hydrophila]|uniref:hypothetical protein n=1 Tax=Aeromonas hydrophila TaxID=644 RepID=UPI002167468E|nr:hypothetical protein [Aeromonas hydrophila]MCS3769649.1 hypothetical protein [Aeromonas hydrophila]
MTKSILNTAAFPSDAVEAAANRVTITDYSNQGLYSERLEGSNEGSALELTNAGASTHYLNMLADRLDGALNGTQWKTEIAMHSNIFRFHREGDTPPAIMVPSLVGRSVTVNMQDPYSSNTMPAKLTVRQGETIVSKPGEDALLVSMAIERFDSEVDGVITELTLAQEMLSIGEQLDEHVTVSILNSLLTHKNSNRFMSRHELGLTVGMTAPQRVEAIEDALDEAMNRGRQLGAKLEDFIVGLNAQCYRDVERIARRAGAASVADYLGTDVYSFAGQVQSDEADVQLAVAPRRHVAISFREAVDGKVFDLIVSRQADKQSTTLELMATADMLVAGFTKASTVTGQSIEVNLPLVQVYTAGSGA